MPTKAVQEENAAFAVISIFTFQSEYPGSIGLNKSALILGPHPVFPANPVKLICSRLPASYFSLCVFDQNDVIKYPNIKPD